MAVSAAQLAKRAFVSILLDIAAIYSVTVRVNWDSDDKTVMTAFRAVVKKAHPDKGGQTAHSQKLHAAKESWEKAREAANGIFK